MMRSSVLLALCLAGMLPIAAPCSSVALAQVNLEATAPRQAQALPGLAPDTVFTNEERSRNVVILRDLLIAAGYATTPAYDRQTYDGDLRRAVRAFQMSKNIPQSDRPGFPTPETLRELNKVAGAKVPQPKSNVGGSQPPARAENRLPVVNTEPGGGVVPTASFRLWGRGPHVIQLRKALAAAGIQSRSAGEEERYDLPLVAAVKQFQTREQLLPVTGLPGKRTLERLNAIVRRLNNEPTGTTPLPRARSAPVNGDIEAPPPPRPRPNA